jgi:hypothetical protein
MTTQLEVYLSCYHFFCGQILGCRCTSFVGLISLTRARAAINVDERELAILTVSLPAMCQGRLSEANRAEISLLNACADLSGEHGPPTMFCRFAWTVQKCSQVRVMRGVRGCVPFRFS